MVPTGKVTGALVVARSLYSYVVMTERVRVLGRIRHASDTFAGEIEANSMLDGGTEAMAERATELAGRGPCALATSINWDTGRACPKISRSSGPTGPVPPTINSWSAAPLSLWDDTKDSANGGVTEWFQTIRGDA